MSLWLADQGRAATFAVALGLLLVTGDPDQSDVFFWWRWTDPANGCLGPESTSSWRRICKGGLLA